MATITWPSALPQCFQRNSYQEEMEDNIISAPFEVGPAGLRRRVTANVSLVAGNMFMSTVQWEALQDFIDNEILERSLAFGFPVQPIEESPPEEWLVLMNKEPTRSWLGDGDTWLVMISLVVLPQ